MIFEYDAEVLFGMFLGIQKSHLIWMHLKVEVNSPLSALCEDVVLTFSDSVSRAEVASSSNNTVGFLTSARAMATLCF